MLLTKSADNSALGKVIRGHGDYHPVAGQHANHVYPHFAGQMAKHNLSSVKLNAKKGVRQIFYYFAFQFNDIFICLLLPKVGCTSGDSRET